MPPKKLTYEKALANLEEIVAKMEEGGLSLDDSIALYKEGVELARFCDERLNRAEGELSILQQTTDGFSLKPIRES